LVTAAPDAGGGAAGETVKIKALLTVVLVLLVGVVTAPPAAAAEPAVTVSPSTGLEEGTQLSVRGSGLPAGVEVSVTECDHVYEDDQGGLLSACPTLATVTVSARGTVKADVGAVGVTSRREFGAEVPVYCNQNTCRVFLVWDDPDQGKSSVGSGILEYATVTVASVSAVRSATPWVTASASSSRRASRSSRTAGATAPCPPRRARSRRTGPTRCATP
jgi:hypothetical protein